MQHNAETLITKGINLFHTAMSLWQQLLSIQVKQMIHGRVTIMTKKSHYHIDSLTDGLSSLITSWLVDKYLCERQMGEEKCARVEETRHRKCLWANYCGHFQAFILRHEGSQIKGGEKWIVLMICNGKRRIHVQDFTANHRPLWFIAHLIRLARLSHDACFPSFPLPGLPTLQPCQGQPEEMIPLHHKIYTRFTPVCLPVYKTHRLPARCCFLP